MSNQLRLRAFNERLSGEYYIGRTTIQYQPEHLIRSVPIIPSVFPIPEMKYCRDPDIESFETLSINSDENNTHRKQPFEYRITGITWHTPRYVNTCSIDNFLSAWVRKMRQTHGKYLKYLKVEDLTCAGLYAIADHALCAKDKVDAEHVKGLWLYTVLLGSEEISVMNKLPVECTGQNTFSVFQHLRFHNSFEIVSLCDCGTFYNRDFILEVPDLQQIEILGNPKRLNEADMPKCLRCNRKRILLELNPDATNWLLVFHYNGTKEKRNHTPKFSDIPQILQMGAITFKLEYLAYCQEVDGHPDLYHEVSIQFIRHQWYLYDGVRSPKFRRWGSIKYAQCNAYLTTLVYFRI